jgi:hypothetical protein
VPIASGIGGAASLMGAYNRLGSIGERGQLVQALSLKKPLRGRSSSHLPLLRGQVLVLA